jgi:hypothetical protein
MEPKVHNSSPSIIPSALSFLPMKKNTDTAILLNEVHHLISAQIKTFGQPEPLTPSQLCEFHSRTDKIMMLYEELDQLGTRQIMEDRFKTALSGHNRVACER